MSPTTVATAATGAAKYQFHAEAGGWAILYADDKKVTQLPADTVASRFFGREAPLSGLLPPAIRAWSNNGNVFVLERPPQIAHLTVRSIKKSGHGTAEIFAIPLPWTVVVAQFSNDRLQQLYNIHVYARNSPISSLEDRLYLMPLSNIYSNEEGVCLPQKTQQDWDKLRNSGAWSFEAGVNFVWNAVFNAEFNDDLGQTIYGELMPEQLAHLQSWSSPEGNIKEFYEGLAKIPLADMVRLAFKPSNYTLGSLLEEQNIGSHHSNLPTYFRSLLTP